MAEKNRGTDGKGTSVVGMKDGKADTVITAETVNINSPIKTSTEAEKQKTETCNQGIEIQQKKMYKCPKCEWRSDGFKCLGVREHCKSKLSRRQRFCTQCTNETKDEWFTDESSALLKKDSSVIGYTCNESCNIKEYADIKQCPKCESTLKQCVLCPNERHPCNNIVFAGNKRCTMCKSLVKKTPFDGKCLERVEGRPCHAVIRRRYKCCSQCGHDVAESEDHNEDVRSNGIKCPGKRKPCQAKISKDQKFCTQCKQKINQSWFNSEHHTNTGEPAESPLTGGYACSKYDENCPFTSEDSLTNCPICGARMEECVLCLGVRQPCDNAVYIEDDFCSECGWEVDKRLFGKKCNAGNGDRCFGHISDEDRCCPKCGKHLPKGMHKCSIKHIRDKTQAEETKTICKVKNVEKPNTFIRRIFSKLMKVNHFASIMEAMFGAVLDEIKAGCLVFVFLHKTKESAQRMIDEKNEVAEHIKDFLNKFGVPFTDLDIDLTMKTDESQNVMETITGDLVNNVPGNVALALIAAKHHCHNGNVGSDSTQQTEESVQHMLSELKSQIQGRKDLFPLLSDMMKLVRVAIPYIEVKTRHLELAIQGEQISKGSSDQLVKDVEDQHNKDETDEYDNAASPSMNPQRVGSENTASNKSAPGIGETENVEEKLKLLVNHLYQMKGWIGDMTNDLIHCSKRRPKSEWDIRMQDLSRKISQLQDIVTDVIGEDQPPVPIEKSLKDVEHLQARDYGLWWETNVPYFSKDMSQLKTQDIDADVIGEDQPTVPIEKSLKDVEHLQARDPVFLWETKMAYLSKDMSQLKTQDTDVDVIGEDQPPIPIEEPLKDVEHLQAADCGTTDMTPSILVQLRHLQYGRLQQKDLYCIVRLVMIDDQRRLASLQRQSDHLEHVFGSQVHIVGEIDSEKSGPVSCLPMTLSRERVHKDLAVSGNDQELVNRERSATDHHPDQFKKYEGTCGRETIPTSPSPSRPSTYWETHTQIQVKRDVDWLWTLLEMGVCTEGEVDRKIWISRQRRAWCVLVRWCYDHKGICTQVWEEGRRVGECLTNTMSNTPGTVVNFRYGIILDSGRGRLAFLDVNRGQVLYKFQVRFTESLRPMFSVPLSCDDYDVKMRLVSGSNMTDQKLTLLEKALFG